MAREDARRGLLRHQFNGQPCRDRPLRHARRSDARDAPRPRLHRDRDSGTACQRAAALHLAPRSRLAQGPAARRAARPHGHRRPLLLLLRLPARGPQLAGATAQVHPQVHAALSHLFVRTVQRSELHVQCSAERGALPQAHGAQVREHCRGEPRVEDPVSFVRRGGPALQS